MLKEEEVPVVVTVAGEAQAPGRAPSSWLRVLLRPPPEPLVSRTAPGWSPSCPPRTRPGLVPLIHSRATPRLWVSP